MALGGIAYPQALAGSVAQIVSESTNAAAATSITLTFNKPIPVGHSIVVTALAASGATPTISNTLGATATEVTSGTTNAGEVMWLLNGGSGSGDITVTFSTSSTANYARAIDFIGDFSISNVATPSSTSATFSSGFSAGEILVAHCITNSSGNTATTGFYYTNSAGGFLGFLDFGSQLNVAESCGIKLLTPDETQEIIMEGYSESATIVSMIAATFSLA